jgi:hypothetical protein
MSYELGTCDLGFPTLVTGQIWGYRVEPFFLTGVMAQCHPLTRRRDGPSPSPISCLLWTAAYIALGGPVWGL